MMPTLGGERAGGAPGRGSENELACVAAVQMREHRPAQARSEPAENFSFAALRAWAERTLAPSGARVTSDGLPGFEVLERLGFQHDVVITPRDKTGIDIEPCRWLNTLLGNLKTELAGSHHASAYRKYAHRYSAEVGYHFNGRYDLAVMVYRPAVALIRTTPCSYGDIQIAAETGT